MVFRNKLIFNELPTIDKLHLRRPDLYPDELLCSLCHMELETNEHVWFCSAPSTSSHQDTFKKIVHLARDSLVIKLTNLWQKDDRNKYFPYNQDIIIMDCWSLPSSPLTWSCYDLLRGFIPQFLVDVVYAVTRKSDLTESILNKLIFKLQDRAFKYVWKLRCDNMIEWEKSNGITCKLKLRGKSITHIPIESLSNTINIVPMENKVTYDSSRVWLNRSITCGLKWYNYLQDFLSSLTVRLVKHSVLISW